MKYRKDFVTNSSSSSYICEVCGEGGVYYEQPDFLVNCVNGHVFCEEHLLADREDAEDENGEISSKACPLCSFVVIDESNMAKYLEITRGVAHDEVFAEIKRLNKRRKVLRDEEYIAYVLAKIGMSDVDVNNEIKARFGDWDAYCEFLREER